MRIELFPGDDIQAAIAIVSSTGGGEVYLNAGICACPGPEMLVLNSKVNLVGAGRYSTIIRPAFSGNFMVVEDAASIRHLTIDGDTEYTTGIGITIADGQGYQHFEDIEVKNFPVH